MFGSRSRAAGALAGLALNLKRGFQVDVPVYLGRHCEVSSHRDASVHIGAWTYISSDFTLVAKGRVKIGERCFLNRGVTIAAFESITIGAAVLVGPYATIHDHDHDIHNDGRIRDRGFATSPIVIGSNVLIGAKASILKGITIGDGAVVGANAVVTDSVLPGQIVVGSPARVVGARGRLD